MNFTKITHVKLSLISMGIMILIVLLGDLKIGIGFLYLHHIPELLAFQFFGSFLKENNIKFYPLLLFYISYGLVYWSVLHSGYFITLLFLYSLMFPLFIGYFLPIIKIEKK